jgi:hypothetical protein
MPDLGLPRMSPAARAAIRAVLQYEKPSGNGSVRDILEFAEARGFVAHPSDWVPHIHGDDQFPPRYEPWSAWLAERGYTPFWQGVRLTAENWHRWTAEERGNGLSSLLRHDRPAALDLLMTLGVAEAEASKRLLLSRFDVGRSFNGSRAKDVAVLHHFLRDPSDKVRELARYKLANLEGLESEEANAAKAMAYFTRAADGTIRCGPEVHGSAGIYLAHTTFDILADVLEMTPEDLASRIDLADVRERLHTLIMYTANPACRAIVAKRLVEAGQIAYRPMLEAADRETWRKSLRLCLASGFPNTVFEFLGPEAGTLDISDIRQIGQARFLGSSVTGELQDGTLPVNIRHDPLRSLALLANREAAQVLLDEALALGMQPDNPRLSMLRLNLAL